MIDINRVPELDYMVLEGKVLRIGALVRHAQLERSDLVARHVPVLVDAVRHVGHSQIRNRGTLAGSVAHADPAAELPAALAALDACFHVQSTRGRRRLAWHEFFVGPFTTTLQPDELLVEIEVPIPQPGTRQVFLELARRKGDFAIGGVATLARLDAESTCSRVAVGLLSAGPTTVRATSAERLLMGHRLTQEAIWDAAEVAVREIEPLGDVQASQEF